MRIFREDGTITDSIASASVIRDSQGQALGYISLHHDITARKQAEERLQNSESRYRLATRATNDVIWEWDVQTNELAWAENVLFVFGYPPEEIGPEASWKDDHIHPEDRQRVISTRVEAMQGSELIWADEYRFLVKNGSYATIRDQGFIERDVSGQAVRLIGAMSDISGRKQADDRIQRQLHRHDAFDLRLGELRAAEDRRRDHLVGIADENRPHFASTLHRCPQAFGEAHSRELLRSGLARPGRRVRFVARNARFVRVGLDQRFVHGHVDRRDLHRKDAAVGEELAGESPDPAAHEVAVS